MIIILIGVAALVSLWWAAGDSKKDRCDNCNQGLWYCKCNNDGVD